MLAVVYHMREDIISKPQDTIDYSRILTNAFMSCVNIETVNDPIKFAHAVKRFYITLLPSWRKENITISLPDGSQVTITLQEQYNKLIKALGDYQRPTSRKDPLHDLTEKLKNKNNIFSRILNEADKLYMCIIQLLDDHGYIEYKKVEQRGGLTLGVDEEINI